MQHCSHRCFSTIFQCLSFIAIIERIDAELIPQWSLLCRDMTVKQYEYKTLEADEIRLLELHPGDLEADLHGVLHQFRLPEDDEIVNTHEVFVTREGGHVSEKAPSYEALSYTWGGNPRARKAIHVVQDGKVCQLPIKPNLFDALQRLRKDVSIGESRMLWIDAICIHQVRRLPIYSSTC